MIKKINNRIYFLDILRVFAFTSVLVGHKFYAYLINYINDANTHITIKFFLNLLSPLFAYGGAGVVVFFLVSGYTIAMVISVEKVNVFLIKRFFRIYPLFIFAVTFEIILGYYLNNQQLPSLPNYIIQISLMGDFFKFPLALNFVEWTLRIEIIFYLLIALIKSINLFNYKNFTILIFCLITIFLYKYGPFVNVNGFSKGYVTLYMPFLFMGSIVFFIEQKKCNIYLGSFAIALILLMYYKYLYKINPTFIGEHFTAYGLILFYFVYKVKNTLPNNKVVIFFSGLTYSIYLFHNWLWIYIQNFISTYISNLLNVNLLTVFFLILFCYIINVTFEKYFMNIGSRLIRKYFSNNESILTK